MTKQKAIIAFCFLFGNPLRILAQDSIPNRFYREQLDFEIQSLHPYLMDNSNPLFYEAGIGYFFHDGIRIQPFGATKSRALVFDTRSRIQVQDWAISGKFYYSKDIASQRPYLLQSDRFLDIPYLVLDEQNESWSGDDAGLQLSVKSPKYGPNNKLGTTIFASYEVGSTTRRSEPRPLARYNEYMVNLQESFLINDHWEAGLGMGIRSGKEEVQIGNFSVQDVRFLQARGMYTFTSNTFRTFQRSIFVKEFNYLIFLSHRGKNHKSFVEFRIDNEKYNIRDGIAFPVGGGQTSAATVNLISGYQYQNSGKSRFEMYFKFKNKNQFGTDPVFRAINIETRSNEISYEAIWHSLQNSPWQIGSKTSITSNNTMEIAANTNIQLLLLNTSLYFMKEHKLSQSDKILFKPNIAIQSGSVDKNENASTTLSELIVPPIMAFYSQSYLEPGIGLFWEHLLSKNQLFSFSLSYTTRVSNNFPFNEFSIRTALIL